MVKQHLQEFERLPPPPPPPPLPRSNLDFGMDIIMILVRIVFCTKSHRPGTAGSS